jgi:hypothetical protein
MTTQKAPPIIERRVTAWHEAGHAIAVLTSKHFDVSDPAIDLRPSSRGHANAGARRLFMAPRITNAEAREIVKIAYSGRIGEDWLEAISRDEGQTIYPDPGNTNDDFGIADRLLVEHQLEVERDELWSAAQEVIGTHAVAFIALADHVWKSPFDVLSRAQLLQIPEVSELAATIRKEAPSQADSSSNERGLLTNSMSEANGVAEEAAPHQTAAEVKVTFWRRIARLFKLMR